MRALTFLLLLSSTCLAQLDVTVSKARLLERDGDSTGALQLLRSAAQRSTDPGSLSAFAEFLDRRRDPEARAAYDRLLATLPESNRQRQQVARRLVILDLLAGDQAAARRHLDAYKAAGGTDLNLDARVTQAARQATIDIPGPLRSFSRMAALSPDLSPEDVLAGLARNVVTNGYQASSSAEGLEPTEYLKLVMRYLSQARELEKLAGTSRKINLETCESAQTADLLRILGYRMRGGCGSDVVLETVNATRAFLTIDSGFPLAQLEQALRTNRPFTYDFEPTVIPVLYGPDYWTGTQEKQPEMSFIDLFIGDPALCRLYLGFSKLDHETADAMKAAVPAQRLKAFAHVLDFYGGMFEIRKGQAVVPGGPRAAAAWGEIAGKAPQDGTAFFERLLTRDDGWMASYYDAVARMNGAARDYLLDPKRMMRLYTAIRGRVTSPGPARPVFRANTDMLLLTQRLRLDADGRVHIPGGLDIWKTIFAMHPHGKFERGSGRNPASWKEPDDLLDALFTMTRRQVENEPLKMYMTFSDLNRHRARPLEPATVERLTREYRTLGAQYAIFNEVPTVSDKTIVQFLDAAQGVSRLGNQATRANAAGTMQGLVGLWQIFARQEFIRQSEADGALAELLTPFATVRNEEQVFDAGRAGVRVLLKAARTAEGASPQDRIMDLVAGGADHSDRESRQQVMQQMAQIFDAQKLISLKTIFEVADHFDAVAGGEKPNVQLLNRFNSRIAEIQSPRASLSTIEKNTLTFGYWTEKHVEAQRKVNMRAAVERAGTDKERLAELRGLLTPFLRDTLVGFNYLHYAPPGAQILITNPLFVRTHDFIGLQSTQQTWRNTEVYGTGWPSNAGGRLMGSLVSLPYALAEAEQNFLIPTREQALIWGDLVPQMIISAKVPRWWNVSPAQLEWVSLHMNRGESLIAEAALDPARRTEILDLLGNYAPPSRVREVETRLLEGSVRDAVDRVTPSELFLLASSWWSKYKDEDSVCAQEVRRIAADSAEEVTPRAISRAFGTPKPTLAHSYAPELLNLRTFPTLMGYSSRVMAESWESNILYYAALASELHMRPSQLNIAIPQWTQQTVERIFATHLEDWPALLRSLRLVGDEARARMRVAASTSDQKASLD
jgi:hypothetical protein